MIWVDWGGHIRPYPPYYNWSIPPECNLSLLYGHRINTSPQISSALNEYAVMDNRNSKRKTKKTDSDLSMNLSRPQSKEFKAYSNRICKLWFD